MDGKDATAQQTHLFKRIHFLVRGDVQGVGFRAFVVDRASGIGLTGWVRNQWDGNVEGEAEGDSAAIMKLIAYLKKGPISSHVESVGIQEIPVTGENSNFRINR